MPAPLLEVKNLSIDFTMYERGLRKRTSNVIKDLSVSIDAGEVVAVVGASGSGKSLLANAILSILPANAHVGGTIHYQGASLTAEKSTALRGRDISLIPQSLKSFDPLMPMRRQICRHPSERDRYEAILKRYELDAAEIGKLRPFEISGGMARRLLVATALVKSPKLIIADEPTPGMTADQARETMIQFREAATGGAGVMVITHDLELALAHADRLVLFHDGRSVEEVSCRLFGRQESKPSAFYSQALWRAMPQNEFEPTSQATLAQQIGYDAPSENDQAQSMPAINSILSADLEPASHELRAQSVDFRFSPTAPLLIRDFSIELKSRDRVGLFGPSGFGKSTIGKLLANYMPPDAGHILLNGAPLPSSGYAPVQMIFQHPDQAIDPNRKILAALKEGGMPSDECIEALGIEEAWLNRWPNELSGGQLQRICVARAMGPRTKFLIADEISTMLDAISQAHIWQYVLREVECRGLGLLMISHDRPLMQRICTRIIDLEQEGIRQAG